MNSQEKGTPQQGLPGLSHTATKSLPGPGTSRPFQIRGSIQTTSWKLQGAGTADSFHVPGQNNQTGPCISPAASQTMSQKSADIGSSDFPQSAINRRQTLLNQFSPGPPQDRTISSLNLSNRRHTTKYGQSLKRPLRVSVLTDGVHRTSLSPSKLQADMERSLSSSDHYKRMAPMRPPGRTDSRVMFSLSQLSHIVRQESNFGLPFDNTKGKYHRKSCIPISGISHMCGGEGDVINIPLSQDLKNFQKEYLRQLEDTALKRKSLRCRKRWLRAYRKAMSMLRISKNMAERSLSFEKEPSTYVDIGDSVTMFVDYGAGRSIDLEMYKRKKEISISTETEDTLTSVPEERTLLQLEKARRALQIVQMFSEYPLDVQEQILRRAFYQSIGPKRVILRQGHIAHNFYIIICGEAYVKRHVWDEEKIQMVAKTDAFIKNGDTFGSEALINGVDRTKSVISRTSMQLLAVCGEDYLDLIFRRSLPDQLPPYIQYISEMNFMENFPIHLLKGKLTLCALHHFRRNTVITHDSSTCSNLFIIKQGYCKVFRKLHDSKEIQMAHKISLSQKRGLSTEAATSSIMSQQRNVAEVSLKVLDDQRYIEKNSPNVSYKEIKTPMGHTVQMPVTKAPGKMDKVYHQHLTLPQEQRKFVPLMLLREGAVFGLDQTDMCPSRSKSRPTILVSLGAEVIALNKHFYCRHAAEEAREVSEKIFICDDLFIRQRLKERVNRDVHLEEVLNFYFIKLANGHSHEDAPHIHL